ncbi:HD domain-containing protein [Paenibacillus filicis]|uniref:HD domain-containing protein n=1 Tax=Paenibacillus filicis TaxID=669464 RepID=A0ABU9DHU2_9BACL
MHPIFQELTASVEFTHDLKRNVQLFLTTHHCSETADHCMDVGAEARRVAIRFGADPDAAETAGWLHDISAVIPNKDRIEAARQLQIEVLPEEEQFPMIIHQKLSKAMARDIFQITDQAILDAVGCHTTLRAGSTLLDQVLFVADKIAWDQTGVPPFQKELNDGLEQSLAHGAFAYIDYLWQRKETLKVVHPWLKDAHEELRLQLK